MKKCTLALGCFWKPEENFKNKPGIIETEVGYAGGDKLGVTYEEVCRGKTGHAEVAQIVFDNNILSYKQILNVFWQAHNPTTLNRQGNDVGTQYRSVIFYHNEDQKEIAEWSKQDADKSKYWSNPIVTEITNLNNYSDAEDYHDNYYDNNPNQPYCLFVIRPKLN